MNATPKKLALIQSFDALRTRTEFASAEYEQLLRENNLASLPQVTGFDVDESSLDQRHLGRQVWPVDLSGDGRPRLRAYVKVHVGTRRLWPRSTDLKAGNVLQSHPIREWNGLVRLKGAGIPVAEPMAIFHRGWLRFESAIITRAVPPEFSIDDLLQQRKTGQFDAEEWQSLLDNVMDTLNQIYQAGLGWKGASSRHFFPERQSDGSWKNWLIDCEGVHCLLSPKVVDREQDKLLRSFVESGADEATLDHLKRGLTRRRDALFAKVATTRTQTD